MKESDTHLLREFYAGLAEARKRQTGRLRRMGDMATAAELDKCGLFTGKETVDELLELFRHPQALEFYLMTGFPTLAMLRRFKECGAGSHGIYIDAGDIELHNPGNVVLAGETRAVVTCDSTELHGITAVHGATAAIQASGWAVVRPERDRVSHVVSYKKDNAIIL